MKLAVGCVLAVSVAGLSAMLIQGCKREQAPENPTPPEPTNNFAVETNPPPATTNLQVALPPVATNPPVIVPPTPEPTGTEYAIVKGDTLAKVAKAHGVTLKALEDANQGVVPTKLKIGQKLTIPAGSAVAPAPAGTVEPVATGETYTVKSGDTLTKIAKAHGVTLKTLEAANPKVDPNHVKVGMKLNIPAKVEAAAPAPAPAPVAPPAPAAAPVTTPPPAGTSN